ncbi:hypothetical protein XELAEV_18008159mg [Xenopus laevis]|uniref:Uncharacterized protein n=1 Tax=Xenopus laevis TaxID=8355 RepID=A0A974I5R7_XENLA|nr:hypothetical protein XELAEV_18008159mg [Xenopus laevis]
MTLSAFALTKVSCAFLPAFQPQITCIFRILQPFAHIILTKSPGSAWELWAWSASMNKELVVAHQNKNVFHCLPLVMSFYSCN